MTNFKIIICFILTHVLVLQNLAQSPVLDPIQKQFNVYQQERLQEKVFLHTDKEFYLTGEICWFKLYCVDAYFHKPLDLSKVAYVEIIDRHNKPVLQAKIALKEGLGNGSWDLPISLPSGNFKIRAYTSMMKNFIPEYFFEKSITIINPDKAFVTDTISVKSRPGIRFYPEGGNLVNGLKSKLAFRAYDPNGKGLKGEGIVVNNAGETILKFSPQVFGIGSFLFTPKPGQTYTAKLTLPNGDMIQQDLPLAFNEGWVMHLEQRNENQLKVTVMTAANQPVAGSAYLFVHTRNTVQTALNSSFQDGQAIFLIDKNKLGDGISHFTVFNSAGNPVCERLYFKYPEKSLELDIQAVDKSFDQREKVNLQITSGENSGRPVPANMSLAVYLIDSVQGISDADIKNHLWLSSDLAGVIESPGFYFENKGIGKEEATDNLMLTHGWRRFRWEDILQHKKPVFEYIPEYAGHIVTGKVTAIATGLPVMGISCYLSVTGSQKQFRNAISDSAGIIRFDLGEFYNDGEVIVQPNGKIDSLYNIEIFKPFSEKYSTNAVPGPLFSTANAGILNNHFGNLQISNTYNGNKQNQLVFPKADTSAFYLKPDFTYLLDNFVRFTTMEEVLREYVVPVNVRKHDGEFHLYIFDKARNETFATDPLVLLDGVPVFNTDKFMQYDPLKVRKLEVVSKGYYLGKMAFTGIANFTTYSNNLQDYELDIHATVLDYNGLQLRREFYAPEYSSKEQLASRLPDFRNLLYWNPDITTNESGKVDVSFYSSDLPGKYVVVLQGLSNEGKAGCGITYFEIIGK